MTIIPGALVILFVRNYNARGFALGRGVRDDIKIRHCEERKRRSNPALGAQLWMLRFAA